MRSSIKDLYFFNPDKLPRFNSHQRRIQRLLTIIYFFVYSVPIVIISDTYLAIMGKQAYTAEKFPVLVFWICCLLTLWLVKRGKFLIAKLIIIFVPLLFITSYSVMDQVIGEHFLWQPIVLIGLSIIPFLVLDYKTERVWIIVAFISFLIYIIFHDQIMLAGAESHTVRTFDRLNTTPFIYHTVRIIIFLFLSGIIFYAVRFSDGQQLLAEEMNESLWKTGRFLEEINAELNAHRNAIDTSASLIITNRNFAIESVNADFIAGTGYSMDELKGKKLHEVLMDEDTQELFPSLIQTAKKEKVWRGEMKIRQHSGEHIWMNTAISVIDGPDENQERYLCLMINITPLKHHEERLEKLNHEKDRILYAVAHDLKNPLLNLKALVNLLQSGSMKEGEIKEIFRLMTKECDHSTSLISELLEIGRLEDNNFVLIKSPTILHTFLERSLQQFQQAAEAKKIKFTTSLDPSVKTVDVNEIEFTRVAYNLISNAIKFTPEGGEIRLSTYYTEKANDRFVTIEISDTGVGISMDLLPIIFDKFSKASRVGIGGEKSTGLGMWIVKHIVELHGGEIKVTSSENAGTTFKISLPA